MPKWTNSRGNLPKSKFGLAAYFRHIVFVAMSLIVANRMEFATGLHSSAPGKK